MWLQVNMIDETEKVLPVWSLSAAQMQTENQWMTGRVKLVSKDNGDQYRVTRTVSDIKFNSALCLIQRLMTD
jgi:hypothetical protein